MSALAAVDGFPITVRASPGLQERARAIAPRVVHARAFLSEQLDGIVPDAGLLVLAEEDWASHSGHPAYGMPNASSGNIVVAGNRSEFWRGFAAMMESAAPAEDRAALTEVYGAEIDLSPFFDLVAVHELAHLFHRGFRFPTPWLVELFVNVALHAYVATEEPEALPVLETFPRVFSTLDSSAFAHTSVADLNRLYDTVDPANYGWYQVNLHAGAKRIFDAGGLGALRGMWAAFAATPERVAKRLEAEVHPEAARVLRDWPGGA